MINLLLKMLRYKDIVAIKSTDKETLYYSKASLIMKCKYFKDFFEEHQTLELELPFKAKQIDNFLRYMDSHQRNDEGDNWFDEEKPKGLTVLKFARDVCLVADYIDYDRSWEYGCSLEEILGNKYNANIDLFEKILNHMKLELESWRGPYLGFKFMIKRMKALNDPYLSKTSEELLKENLIKFKQRYGMTFEERTKMTTRELIEDFENRQPKLEEIKKAEEDRLKSFFE